MAIDLSAIRQQDQPARAEYMGQPIQLRYRLGIITPAWSAELQNANAGGVDEFLEKIIELVSKWDLTDVAPAFDGKPRAEYDENGRRTGETKPRYEVGDLIAHEGRVFRCFEGGEVETELTLSEGMATSGECGFEAIGSADARYEVPLTIRGVSSVPAPILGACVRAVTEAANTGVSDSKSAR